MTKQSLLLELVPPLLSSGDKGLHQCIDYIHRCTEQLCVEAVVVPELHEEQQRGDCRCHLTPTEARVPTCEFAAHIGAACQLDCIVNHRVVTESEQNLREWLRRAHREFGVHRFVLVGGESSRVSYPGPSVARANRIAREVLPSQDVQIGNICIPSRASETQRLDEKIASGVDFFSTQIIYSLDELVNLSRALMRTGIDTAAVTFYISFCPISSPGGLRFLERLGVTMPNAVAAWLVEQPQLTLQRSKHHIDLIWQQFQQHLRDRPVPLSVAANLSPIGDIPVTDTIDLGRCLSQLQRSE